MKRVSIYLVLALICNGLWGGMVETAAYPTGTGGLLERKFVLKRKVKLGKAWGYRDTRVKSFKKRSRIILRNKRRIRKFMVGISQDHGAAIAARFFQRYLRDAFYRGTTLKKALKDVSIEELSEIVKNPNLLWVVMDWLPKGIDLIVNEYLGEKFIKETVTKINSYLGELHGELIIDISEVLCDLTDKSIIQLRDCGLLVLVKNVYLNLSKYTVTAKGLCILLESLTLDGSICRIDLSSQPNLNAIALLNQDWNIFRNLKEIVLYDNDISMSGNLALVDFLLKAKKLQGFCFYDNDIYDESLERLIITITKMTRLKELHFVDKWPSSMITDLLIPSLEKLTQLKIIDLSYNSLGDSVVMKLIPILRGLKDLEEIELSENAISMEVASAFREAFQDRPELEISLSDDSDSEMMFSIFD